MHWKVVSVTAVCAIIGSPAWTQPPSFITERTTACVNEALVLPLALSAKSTTDQSWNLKSTPPNAIRVLKQPSVLTGHDLAFTRIIPLQPGTVQLHLAEGSSIKNSMQLDVLEKSDRPDLTWIAPAEGAAIKGPTLIGVEWNLRDVHSRPWESLVPELRIPGLPPLPPREVITHTLPSHVRLIYEVDAASLPEGWNSISIHLPGQPAALLEKTLYALPGTVPEFNVEAEDLQEPLVDQGDKGKKKPVGKLQEDAKASGGKSVGLYGNRQTIPTRFPVEENGFYQCFVRVKPTLFGNTTPSLGLFIDNENQPLTDVRTLFPDWHSLPLGRPVYLEKGEPVLSIRMLNDFGAKKKSRDSFIDTFSLVRLPDATSHDPKARNLQVAFDNVIDGKTLRGPLRLTIRTHYPKIEEKQNDPPRVAVLVNGREAHAAYRSVQDVLLPTSLFQAGKNLIQLEAAYGNNTVQSTPQSVFLRESPSDPPSATTSTDHFFYSRDPRWEPAVREFRDHFEGRNWIPILAMNSNGSAILNLPQNLNGEFRAFLRAGGTAFEGHPQAAISIIQDGKETTLADLKVDPNPREIEIGKLHLDPDSPTQLKIAFTNDHFKNKNKDRNLHVYHVRLSSQFHTEDKQSPTLRVSYPPEGHRAWEEDVVIADVFDESGIRDVTLLVNGQPFLPARNNRDEVGPVVLPFQVRHLESGMHRWSLRAVDLQGNAVESEPRSLLVLSDSPDSPGKYHRAVHLLRRLAYGPEPDALASILVQGEDAWLQNMLTTGPLSPGEQIARERAELSNPQNNNYTTPRKVLEEAILTSHPVRARFNFWVQNHFSTWINKAGAEEKFEEHTRFYEAGFTTFSRLLSISAQSPAMLVYLDQNRSFAGKINENYAREIMELHTLSVDGRYRQEDVTELASVLSGWMATREAYPDGRGGNNPPWRFRFEPELNMPNPVTVLGIRLPVANTPEEKLDRIHFVLEALSRHPDTAQFLAEKLAHHYVPHPASPDLVQDLKTTFHRTAGDLRQMMQTLVAHPAFWESRKQGKLATPLDYSIRIARSTRNANANSFMKYLRQSGMGLFERSTPDGYPQEPQAYSDSNAMLQRWHLARDLALPLFNQIRNDWKFNPYEASQARTLAELTTFQLIGDFPDPQSEIALDSLIENLKPKELWNPGLCALVLQLPQTQNR